ncbi:hypothetical protein ACU4GR_02140 [Methylobacterium oryzae CBMB20]
MRLPEPLGLGVERGEIRPVEARRGGFSAQDGDLGGDIGCDAPGDTARAGHGGVSVEVALLLRHQCGDPAAEQQDRDGGREGQRREGATAAAFQLVPGL